MGIFSSLFHRAPPKTAVPGGQPRRDWPWTLDVGGTLWPDLDSWQMVSSQLRALNTEEQDSYLVLEQRDPQDAKKYWFIQSALARMGPTRGQYVLGVGWSAPEHNQLWETSVPDVDRVIGYFDEAFHHCRVDLTGFQDRSDMLP